MKKKWTKLVVAIGAALVLTGGTLFAVNVLGNEMKIVLDGEFTPDSAIEYTNESIQFPMAHVENGLGQVISYDVEYKVVNTKDKSETKDEYAFFDLKTGDYKLVYTYAESKSVKKEIPFSVEDTTAPVIEFTDVPNGLFLQDLSEDDAKNQKLPPYNIVDASYGDGIDLKRTLYFKGENDSDFVETTFRDINGSYQVTEFGKYKYELIATDAYGNTTTAAAEWKIKDRTWKPSEALQSGILADYSSEGYTNYIEGGDANQYYMIGNDYKDEWLAEYEGAKGVFKIDMGFNASAGYGNNTVKLHFANSFTQKDIEGKYLAVRIRVEGENLKEGFLFGGNNIEFRKEDSTTRAFTTAGGDLEFGEWRTYYIDAATVQAIGMYPEGTYNANTTFYEGGKPATCLQLCFSRKAGYYNSMTLYIDSISLAEKLPETEVSASRSTASWTAVKGAAGYKVNMNGEETVVTDTKFTLSGKKGYVKVTPLGDGVLTLDGEETTAVYGLSAGDKLAAFNDELYKDLFSDKLKFSTEAEHKGYRPNSYTANYNGNCVELELGTGGWGVVTGVKVLFPQAKAKGNNTTLVMNMNVSHAKYGQIRVYDFDGQLISTLMLNKENTGKYHKFEIDLSGYDKTLKGVQLIFGPKNMETVAEGVKILFKEMYYANTYYDIQVNGKTLTCAGEKELVAGYTQKELVQFTTFYNFKVAESDTPLSFEGTVLLDGKKLGKSAFSVVGYPDTDTICFKVMHDGKVLTIMKDSIIYHGNLAVKVAKTFNAKWNGKEWTVVSKVPAAPKDEYITVGGEKKLVVNKTELTASYTQAELVQFTNVNDFGVNEDDTALQFEGTVLLDGVKVKNVQVVGYKDNTTICLKVPHNGKVLTVMKDSVIYYGNEAVVVTKTFNAKWNGTSWDAVAKVPEAPKAEYVTVGGEQKLVVNKTELTAGFTAESLVQFTNVYDFGVNEDDKALRFAGTVLLDGVEVKNVQVVGYKDNTTICLKVPHNGKVLTVMKDSVIYYGNEAVVVTKTFNAKWNGTSWDVVAKVPEASKAEYVTVGGEQKLVVNKTTLTAGYTAESLVQFTNFYDFGVNGQDIPLGIEGTVLLDGEKVDAPAVVGYENNTTICLKVPHNGKVLTVKEGAIIYYQDKAVIVKETFNAKWNGSTWENVKDIPTPALKAELKTDYTEAGLVQFKDFYDFGVPANNTPLTFEGTVKLDGVKVDNPQFIGYPNITKICLNIAHGGKILTIEAGSKLSYGGKTVTISKRFHMKWSNANGWEAALEILSFEMRNYATSKLFQVNTNLPSDTPTKDFLATDNGCNIDQSGNTVQQFGYIHMDNADGTIVLTFNFNNEFQAGQTYFLPKGAIFGFTDGKKYELDKDYTFYFDGTSWTIKEPTQQITMTYRWGNMTVLQVNTNLPSTTPLKDFLATDNGCNIDQSGNTVQQFGYVHMANDGGTVILEFHFNNPFVTGQKYVLPKGAIFGFTDGKKYELDKDYSFTYKSEEEGWQED